MGAKAVEYKFGARAGKHKLGTRAGKYKFGARAGKCKLGARAGGREIQIPLVLTESNSQMSMIVIKIFRAKQPLKQLEA